MKLNKYFLYIAIGLFSFYGFKQNDVDPKAQATVKQFNGYYIFTDSKPNLPYDNVGTVKARVGITGLGYPEIKDKLMEKVKREYPYGDAVILRLAPSGSINFADVIKFKE